MTLLEDSYFSNRPQLDGALRSLYVQTSVQLFMLSPFLMPKTTSVRLVRMALRTIYHAQLRAETDGEFPIVSYILLTSDTERARLKRLWYTSGVEHESLVRQIVVVAIAQMIVWAVRSPGPEASKYCDEGCIEHFLRYQHRGTYNHLWINGKFLCEIVREARPDLAHRIEEPHWFCKHYGLGIPLSELHTAKPTFEVDFEHASEPKFVGPRTEDTEL